MMQREESKNQMNDSSWFVDNLQPQHWLVGIEKIDYSKPHTYWVFGKRFAGKSTLVESIAIQYLKRGCQAFDIFSARDNESLAWLRSEWRDSVLLITGDTVELNCSYPNVKISEFTLEMSKPYKIVVTCPGFYSSENEQFAALSHLVDLLKVRAEWDKAIVLMVREAARFLQSRVVGGKVKNRLDAEWEFIDLAQEAYHTGVAVAIDSLRPLSIEINIREISTYTFIKQMGRLSIPRELYIVMRYIDPTYLRRMPKSDYVLYTDSDNIAMGRYNPISWHIERGESIMKSLKIEVGKAQPVEAQEPKPAETTPKDVGAPKKVTQSIHRSIVELRALGKSYADVVDELWLQENFKLSASTVSNELRDHETKRCGCEVAQQQ